MSREFWELTDAEIWGEVDAAWLLEQFRRSEIAERREQVWRMATAAHALLIQSFCARFARAAVEVAHAMQHLVEAMSRVVQPSPAPEPPRCARSAPARPPMLPLPQPHPTEPAPRHLRAQQARLPRLRAHRRQHR